MKDVYHFETIKKEIFDKTEVLVRLIDERNDFFEHAGSVNEVKDSAKIELEKKFVNIALKSGESRACKKSCLGNDAVSIERKHHLLSGRLPSVKTSV